MATQEDYGAFMHRDLFKSKIRKKQNFCDTANIPLNKDPKHEAQGRCVACNVWLVKCVFMLFLLVVCQAISLFPGFRSICEIIYDLIWCVLRFQRNQIQRLCAAAVFDFVRCR